ncbi:hypothetical protein BX600DRAFT_552789 [Xylariales sp. PMI_506]|nr:hypothetical protein BX600DRAFT_552789 [Xylariales sp. PMI_506]
MDQWIHCSHSPPHGVPRKPDALWDYSLFQHGEKHSLCIDQTDDDEDCILYTSRESLTALSPQQMTNRANGTFLLDGVLARPYEHTYDLETNPTGHHIILPTDESISTSSDIFADPPRTPAQPELTAAAHDGLQRREGPDSETWERMKPIIKELYITERKKLEDVTKIMKEKWNFKATQSSSGSVVTPTNGDFIVSMEQTLEQPSPAPPQGLIVTHSPRSALIPEDNIKPRVIINDLLKHVSTIFSSEHEIRKRWKVGNPFEIQENEYDDLFESVAMLSLDSADYGSDEWTTGMAAVDRQLEHVVQECGLFALPTIWVCALRLLRKKGDIAAGMFLMNVNGLAARFHWHDAFGYVVVNLALLNRHSQDLLESGLSMAYRRCLDDVSVSLSRSELTVLSLQSFYTNYVDKACTDRVKLSIQACRKLAEESDLMYGLCSDATLEIMGHWMFQLQSLPGPTDEWLEVANKIDCRIRDRRERNQEPLEGTLLVLWKDMKHLLATFHHSRGDTSQAIAILEEYVQQCQGRFDGYDKLAHDKLENWKKEQADIGIEGVNHTHFCDNSFCVCWGNSFFVQDFGLFMFPHSHFDVDADDTHNIEPCYN